jgi:hypothetical protein
MQTSGSIAIQVYLSFLYNISLRSELKNADLPEPISPIMKYKFAFFKFRLGIESSN